MTDGRYFADGALSCNWFDIVDPKVILSLPPVDIGQPGRLDDRKAIKAAFKGFGLVRNLADGQDVIFPAASAGKMLYQSGVDIRGIAAAFNRLFESSIRAWNEREVPMEGHKFHFNVGAYRNYINRFIFAGTEYFVRFTVREIGNDSSVHASTISEVAVYAKTEDARLDSHPENPEDEHTASFIDHKIAYYLNAVKAINRRPVGFFDSGIGGTCILNAFKRLCPDEETVYIADSKNCPYGNKPAEEIIRLSEANVKKLLMKNCKMIVIACNTATAAAIDYLRAKYPEIPFVGLEPAVKPAALRSKTGVVGVLATAGTFHGRLYNETKAKFAKNVTVIAAQADEFVTEVERLRGCEVAKLRGARAERVEKMVRRRVEPLLKAGADKIVLGCTHFPHLKAVIEKVCAGRAEVIDPSDAVARQAKRVLAAHGLLNEKG